MFKKLFNLKVVLLFTVVLLSFSTFLMFNPAVSEVIYSNFSQGNHLFKGNIYVAPMKDGGNQDLHTAITGQPNQSILAIGTLLDGSTTTICWLDSDETGWTATNARTTITSDEDVYRVDDAGDSSLGIAFASNAVAGDGATGTGGFGDQDLSANDSFGFWLYTDGNIRAGDFEIELVDVGGGGTANIPAVKNRIWTWVECDISGIATKNAVSDVLINITAAGAAAHAVINLYVDNMYTWDAAVESALGVDLVDNGVLSVIAVLTAAGSNNTFVARTEWTNYFTHYEDGNDFIVDMTDNSTYTAIAFLAFK